jgi:hypothetical protein
MLPPDKGAATGEWKESDRNEKNEARIYIHPFDAGITYAEKPAADRNHAVLSINNRCCKFQCFDSRETVLANPHSLFSSPFSKLGF